MKMQDKIETKEKVSKNETEDKSYQKFIDATGNHNDPTSQILKAHLLIEYYIDHILAKNFPRGDVLLKGRLSFSQKLTVLTALDIFSSKYHASIKGLNTVRNSCAHSLDYSVTEADVDKIGMPFGKQYLEQKKKRFSCIGELLHWTLAIPVIQLAAESDS